MAQQVVDYLNKDCFVCSICMERFKNPKMLPCAHTFCSHCLQKVSSSFGGFICPTCRQQSPLTFGGVPELPSSFLIVSLMEKVEMANNSKPSSSACTSCQGTKNVIFCLDCKLNVCSKCKTFHDKIPGTGDHVTVPIERLLDEEYMKEVLASYVPRCDNHKEEKLVLFCLKCNQLLCRDCKILDHSDHKVVTTDEGHSSVRSKLESLLVSAEDQSETIQKISKDVDSSISRVQEHASNARKQVDDCYKEVIERCQSDRDNLLTEIGRKEEHQLQPLREVSEEVEKWNEEMENTMELTRRILDESVKWKLLKEGNALAETLRKLKEEERRLASIGTDLPVQKFSSSLSRKFHFSNMLGNICDEKTDAKGTNLFSVLSSKDKSFLHSARPDAKPSFNSAKPKKSGGIRASAKSDTKPLFSTKPLFGHNISGPSGSGLFTSSANTKKSSDGLTGSGTSAFGASSVNAKKSTSVDKTSVSAPFGFGDGCTSSAIPRKSTDRSKVSGSSLFGGASPSANPKGSDNGSQVSGAIGFSGITPSNFWD